MKTPRPFGITAPAHALGIALAIALAIAAGIGLSGCGGSAQGAAPAAPQVEEPGVLTVGQAGGPGTVVLSAAAEQRLGIRTAPVTAAAGGALTVPYGAVVYQPDGSAWAYVQVSPRHFRREGLTITGITGNTVTLSSGPAAGTLVVVQGGAELVGVETGIDGEE